MIRGRPILFFVVFLLLNLNVFAEIEYTLPKEFQNSYPKRISQNEIMYAPWFKLVGRATSQNMQNGTFAGENCQVTGTISFSDANPNHVIAGFDTNTVAISTDGGENWYYACTDVGTHACQNSIWHPTDENIVYRVSNAYNASRYRGHILDNSKNKGLLRSKDCGKTWEIILNKSMHSEYGSDNLTFDSKGRLYALANDGLYRSSDDGDTWEQLNSVYNWQTYDVVVSEDCMTILTAAVNGINVSFDDGKTWEWRNGKQFYGTATSVDIDPLDENHWLTTFAAPYASFAQSYDKGKTWSGMEQVNLSTPFKIKFGGVRADGTRYIYAVGRSGSDAFYYSTDNGTTWQTANVDTKNGKANRSTQLEGLALSKKYTDIVWYAFADGINCSYDGGKHFYNRGFGHGGQKLYRKIVTDYLGRIHFPGTDTGYFHTETAYSSEKFPACTEPYRLWGGAIAISPHNKNLMMLGGGEQGDMVLYRSYDCGETWRKLTETLSTKSYTLLEFHAKNPKIIYTNQTTSFDGGETWQKNLQTIKAVSPIDNDIVYAADPTDKGDKTEVFVSRNCGTNYKKILSLDGTGYSFIADRFDAESFWIYNSSKDYLLFYNGSELKVFASFEEMVKCPVTVETFAQDPKDNNHILVAISKRNMDIGLGIIETFDGGKTWTVVPGNPGNGWITMICFEERTNDIFINSYCGIMIYDSKAFKNYIENN